MINESSEKISPRLFYLIAAIFLVAVFLLTLKPIADYDAGYHIRTGEYIVAHEAVPLYDVFSYTAPGARWIAHYWLSDVIFYGVDKVFGNYGLIAFVSLLATLTYFIVLKLTWEKIGKRLLPLILFFIFSYLTLELWVVRPQIFTYLFTALLICILEKWRHSKNFRMLYLLIPLFLVWANMHAGVVLGFAVIGLYAVWYCLVNWNRKHLLIKPLVIFAASALATLANPNGYKVLIYSWIIAPVVKQMRVTEWESLFSYIEKWQAKVFLVFLVATLVFVWWSVLRKKKKFLEIDPVRSSEGSPRWRRVEAGSQQIFTSNGVDWISLGLITGAAIMPLISIRHVAFFPLFSLPIASLYLSEWLDEKGVVIEKVLFAVPLTILIGLVLIAGPAIRLGRMPAVLTPPLPIGTADFIRQNNIPGPIFNPEHYGGYLIWKLWPDYKVFVDGRSEIYMGAPNSDYNAILYQEKGWENLVNNKYKINLIVMTYPEFANSTGLKIVEGIHRLGFVTVYYDDTALVFVRDSADNKKIVSEFGNKTVDPFTNISAISQSKLVQAYTEAQRALKISDNALIAKYVVEFLKIRLNQEGIPIPAK